MANAPTNSSALPQRHVPTCGRSRRRDPEVDILHIKLRTLEDGRQDLIKRQREAELYVSDPPGSVRVFAPASLSTIKTNHRRMKT